MPVTTLPMSRGTKVLNDDGLHGSQQQRDHVCDPAEQRYCDVFSVTGSRPGAYRPPSGTSPLGYARGKLGYARGKAARGGRRVRLGENSTIDGLFALLPPPGSIWPKERREQWLAAAAAILGLIYDRPDSACAARPPATTEPEGVESSTPG